MTSYRVTDKSGHEINSGDTVTDFRGDVARFDHVSRGTEYNGTAKVVVSDFSDGAHGREYYARVFDLTVETLHTNAMAIGDRGFFAGLSIDLVDVDLSGPYTQYLVRYFSTGQTEWVPADNVKSA